MIILPEKPRDLLCFTLERALPFVDDRNFKILRSRPGLKKRTDDFSFEVHFNGWKWNRAGENAQFQMVASIQSKTLRDWRNAQPVPVKAMFGRQDGFVAARAFNDPINEDYYSWELSDVRESSAVIARLISVMNQEILPFFHRCSSLGAFAKLGLWPHIWGPSLVELALSRNDWDRAIEVAKELIEALSSEDRRILRDLLGRLVPNDFPQVTGTRHHLGFLAGVILLNELPISLNE